MHPLELRHLGVLSVASKMISEPMVCLAQTCTCLEPTPAHLQMDQNEIPHDPHHLEVPLGASKMISEAMVRSAQTVHLSCIKVTTIFE
jgi:hypothetical protein